MAKRKRQQPEVHPEELVGDGSETPEKRRFRLSNWSKDAAPAPLSAEDAEDVAVVTDEQETAGKGPADDGVAPGDEAPAQEKGSAGSGKPGRGGSAPAEGEEAAPARSERSSRRSGNPAKSGRFAPAAEAEEESSGSSRMTIEDEIHEQRLQRVADEMTAGIGDRSVTPTWYKALMLGLMILGLLWIIVWYITQSAFPIPQIGYGNIGIGIGLMMAGLIMTTRWK